MSGNMLHWCQIQTQGSKKTQPISLTSFPAFFFLSFSCVCRTELSSVYWDGRVIQKSGFVTTGMAQHLAPLNPVNMLTLWGQNHICSRELSGLGEPAQTQLQSYWYGAEVEVAGRQAEAQSRTEVTQVGLGVRGHSEVVEVGCRIGRSWWRGAAIGQTAEDEVEVGNLRVAVQLSLDLLRVGVRCQLLAAALHHQEQAVVLGLRHFKLVGTQLTHLFHGGVRLHL